MLWIAAMDQVSQNDRPPVPDDNRVLFFRRDRDAFGFLSHFHPAPVVLDEVLWPTVEHYYQFQKSFDPLYRSAVRAAEHPARVKKLAQALGRESTSAQPRPDWFAVKRDVMRRADAAKFAQHADLARRLVGCGTAALIEDSPYDAFWGIGRDGAGENWAGRILMEVRDELVRGGAALAGPPA